MLRLNLKEVMDDRKISIQDVYEGTGISRNTISQLYNEKSKGIQFSTLTKLVNFLGLNSVSDLFTDEVNYSGLHGIVEWGEELEKKHDKEKLNSIFSLSPQSADINSLFNTSWFVFTFINEDGEKVLQLPLYISDQSTSNFFQLEGLFDSIDNVNEAYKISSAFSDLKKNIGINKLDCLISHAFSKFMFRVRKSLPNSLKYIGFRTDFGNIQKDFYTISLLWLVDDLTDRTKINNLLSMKYN